MENDFAYQMPVETNPRERALRPLALVGAFTLAGIGIGGVLLGMRTIRAHRLRERLLHRAPPKLTVPQGSAGSGYPDVTRAQMQAVQLQLLELGYEVGTPDGQWAPSNPTFQAVWAFQTAQGLMVDGKPGPNTRERLQQVAGERASSRPDDCDPLGDWPAGMACAFDGNRYVLVPETPEGPRPSQGPKEPLPLREYTCKLWVLDDHDGLLGALHHHAVAASNYALARAVAMGAQGVQLTLSSGGSNEWIGTHVHVVDVPHDALRQLAAGEAVDLQTRAARVATLQIGDDPPYEPPFHGAPAGHKHVVRLQCTWT